MTPDCGIYYDVPFATYLAWDAVSNSKLNLARRSLRHYHEAAWKESTPAMRLGSLVHCGKLEPLAVAERYVVMPEFEYDEANRTKSGDVPSSPRSTGYYKDKVREFSRINADKEVVTREQYNKMLGIVKSLARDERAAQWLNAVGAVECSIVWTDAESGLLCKARIDHAAHGWRRIVDLKTTQDAKSFSKSIANLGYHRQMAHYAAGINALTGREPECCLVAVESESPYCSVSKPLNSEALAIGAAEVRELLAAIADAKQSGEWPGYDSEGSWSLPSWYGGGDAVELIVGGEVVNI